MAVAGDPEICNGDIDVIGREDQDNFVLLKT